VRQWAIFANGNLQIASNLKLVGGLRYTEDNQTASSCTNDAGDGDYARFSQAYQNYAEYAAGYITATQYADGGPGLSADAAGGHGYGVNPGPYGCSIIGPGPTFNPITTPHTLDESNVSWRAGLDWQVQPRTLLYLLVSKGYKSGSFPAVSATLYSEFKAARQESLLSYEVGLKKTWLEGSLVTDLAAYYYEYNPRGNV
jgi:outer membrane receptor protein involved in Fe transport